MNFKIEENEIYLLDLNNEKIAFIKFPKIEGNLVDITTTYVSNELRGQGVAGRLLNLLYDELKRTNRKAKATCSYAINWFEKNIEKQDVLF